MRGGGGCRQAGRGSGKKRFAAAAGPPRQKTVPAARLSHVSQGGQMPAVVAAYQGYLTTSESAQASSMAPTAALACT